MSRSAISEERFSSGDPFGDGDRNDRSMQTFSLGTEGGISPDMTWLAAEIHAGRLAPVVGAVRTWRKLPDAFATGAGRTPGKVGLAVD